MKIQLGNQPYLYRPTGLPLEGRISVYLNDSNNLANVYTLEGNEFVRTVNPLLIHAGLPDDSLFADAGLYRIVVERYTGPEGSMSAESPDEYFEQCDQYETGIDMSSALNPATTVDTLAELASVDPSSHSVTVLGHDSVGDCAPRTYFWDESAVDTVDGGYVVGSNVSDTGRWILLWADEILPATVYGVTPANLSNMNALLSYPDTVGSIHLKTAPCVYFPAGNYYGTLSYSTQRELVMDGNAYFSGATFTCPRVRVIGNSPSCNADFVLTAPDAEAHSSWFRTLNSFWHCGAKYLYLDSVNHFASSQISTNVDLAGKVVSGTRIDCNYASGAHFLVQNTTSIDGRIFNSADYVRFPSGGWGDSPFATSGTFDPGLINQGHHVQYDQAPDLDLFQSADRWLSVMVERRSRYAEQAWSNFTLDFQDRKLNASSVNVGLFRDIRNLHCTGLSVNNSGNDIILRNVSATAVNATCRYLTAYDCDLGFSNEPSIEGIWGHDSRISSATAWRDGNVQCTFDRCRIGISFDRVTDNETLDSVLSFVSSQFADNLYIRSKNVDIKYCTARNLTLKVFPYKVNGEYFIRASLIGNYFNNAAPVEFTRLDTVNGVAQENVYDIRLQWNIVGNTFQGNDEGLRMRYWQDRDGTYYTRTFVKLAPNVHAIAYEGNKGSCPLRDMRGVLQYQTSSTYVEEELSGVTLYKYPQANRKLVPNIVNSQNYFEKTLDGFEMMLTYPSNGTEVYTRTSWYIYPRAKDDSLNDGNFFDWAVVGINSWISADGDNATFKIV